MRAGLLAITFDELLCRRPPVSGTGGGGSAATSADASPTEARSLKSPSCAAVSGVGHLRHPSDSSTKALAKNASSTKGSVRQASASSAKASVAFADLLCERSEEQAPEPSNQEQAPQEAESRKPSEQSSNHECEADHTADQSLPPLKPDAPQDALVDATKVMPPSAALFALSSPGNPGCRPGFPFRQPKLPMHNPRMDICKCRSRSLPTLVHNDDAGGSSKHRSSAQLRVGANASPLGHPSGPKKGRPKHGPGAADDADVFAAFIRQAATTDTTTGRNDTRSRDLRQKLERMRLMEKIARPRPTDEWLYEVRTFYSGAAHEEVMKALHRENVCRSTTEVTRSSDVPEVIAAVKLVTELRSTLRVKTKAQEAKEKKELEKKQAQEGAQHRMMDLMGGGAIFSMKPPAQASA